MTLTLRYMFNRAELTTCSQVDLIIVQNSLELHADPNAQAVAIAQSSLLLVPASRVLWKEEEAEDGPDFQEVASLGLCSLVQRALA